MMRIVAISLLASILLIVGVDSAYAETFDVIIPANASDPRNPFHFIPSDLQIIALDTVTWKNNDSVIHTVTSGTFSAGPNGLFNSGPLEPGDSFSHQFLWEDSGIVTYFCTIHPWVNGIILVQDPEGMPIERVTESGSIESAELHASQGDRIAELALSFNTFEDVINSHHQAARHYNDAAIEYSLLKDYQNAAQYYQKSGLQYHYAAYQLEQSGDLQESIKHHFQAGIQFHYSALQFKSLNDYTNYGKQFAESFKHKRMAKYGSDYVLPPLQQTRWAAQPQEIQCNEGFELVFKANTGEPKCLTPSSASKLVQRGWANR